MPSDPAALYCFAAAIVGGLGITFGSIGLSLLQAGREATPTTTAGERRRPVKLVQISTEPVRYVKPDRVTEVSEDVDFQGRPSAAVRFIDGTVMYLAGHDPHEVAATINAELPERPHGQA